MQMKMRRIFFWFLSLSILSLFAGCSGVATTNELRAREDIKTTESAYRPKDAKPALPNLSPNSSLSDLIQYALLNNPKVESAFYEWKAAVEAITIERSLPNPMLSFSAEITRSVDALSPAIMTDPMGSLPGPGKLQLRAEAAYEESVKKRALFENELLTAALEVKRVYYQLWVLEEEIRLMKETLAVVDEFERLARERLAVGKVAQQDVLRAQIEQDKLKTQLANLEDSRETLKARFRSALGLGPERPLPTVVARLEPSKMDFTEQSLLETAFVRNPRLKAMQSEVKQAIALFQLARKSAIPDFSGGIGVNLRASPLSWMPSVGVTLPIWRDKIAAEIARGGAQLQAARAKLTAEELDLAVMFAETIFAWREADRNVKLYGDKIIPKVAAALESAQAGYTAGISDFMDLLEAQRSLLEFRSAYAMAVGQREMILAEMSFAILGRWPEGVKSLLAPEGAAGSIRGKESSSEREGGK
jgi:outer membrane protein TolC